MIKQVLLYTLLFVTLFASCERKSGQKEVVAISQEQKYDYSVQVVGISDGDNLLF